MSIHLIIGPMFSGKTSRALDIINYNINNNIETMVINHKTDLRYGNNIICSHDNISHKCYSFSKLNQIFNNNYIDIFNKSNFIIIDEAQFFTDLFHYVTLMADQYNKNIIVIGLNGDINRNNFGDIYKLYPHANKIELLNSSCDKCNNEAQFTIKINMSNINSDNIIDIGHNDKYIPICRKCRKTIIEEPSQTLSTPSI